MNTNPLFEIAESIEAAASQDEYFSSRGLYPNADFYGNFVFEGVGVEEELVPAAMLSHRIMGIMAHWREYMGVCLFHKSPVCGFRFIILTDG